MAAATNEIQFGNADEDGEIVEAYNALRPLKIKLIDDYFRVIILERKFNMAHATSLATDLKYNITMPTKETLDNLKDEEIESLLDSFTKYEKLKKTDKNFNSNEHNAIALKINRVVTSKGGKKTRRKRAKRRTRR